MKKIKPNQYVGKVCLQCGQPAEWRATKLASQLTKMYACDEHKQLILDAESAQKPCNDGLSEADYQTWVRL